MKWIILSLLLLAGCSEFRERCEVNHLDWYREVDIHCSDKCRYYNEVWTRQTALVRDRVICLCTKKVRTPADTKAIARTLEQKSGAF